MRRAGSFKNSSPGVVAGRPGADNPALALLSGGATGTLPSLYHLEALGSLQVAGAGERFVLGQMEADLGRCGCCTLVLHLLGWFEPATTRVRDAPVLSRQVIYPAVSTNEYLGISFTR